MPDKVKNCRSQNFDYARHALGIGMNAIALHQIMNGPPIRAGDPGQKVSRKQRAVFRGKFGIDGIERRFVVWAIVAAR